MTTTEKTGYDSHVATNSGNPHNVTKANVGLASADNTGDENKPVSDATNYALEKKVANWPADSGAIGVVKAVSISKTDYTALVTKEVGTLYVINGA